MIVKNGGIFFCKTLVSSESIPADTLKDISGTMYASSISKNDLCLNEAHQNDNQRGIKMRFGVGTTAPTAEDYCLAKRTVSGTDINTLLMCTNASVGYSTHGSVIYTFSFQNSSAAPITVKELCLECTPAGADTRFMVARALIQPRTIASGEIVTFSYTINPCGGA
jgi:hypothetical protein